MATWVKSKCPALNVGHRWIPLELIVGIREDVCIQDLNTIARKWHGRQITLKLVEGG